MIFYGFIPMHFYFNVSISLARQSSRFCKKIAWFVHFILVTAVTKLPFFLLFLFLIIANIKGFSSKVCVAILLVLLIRFISIHTRILLILVLYPSIRMKSRLDLRVTALKLDIFLSWPRIIEVIRSHSKFMPSTALFTSKFQSVSYLL